MEGGGGKNFPAVSEGGGAFFFAYRFCQTNPPPPPPPEINNERSLNNCKIAVRQYHATLHQPCTQMKLSHGYQPIRGSETRSKYDNMYLLHGRACDIAELLHECGLMNKAKLIHTRSTILQCRTPYHAISIY